VTGPVPVRTPEVAEPFPVPARTPARQAGAEQPDAEVTPAKAPSRRAAARTPRARKSVESVSDAAGTQGGDGSAA
jgi:hypothetical protein